MPPAIARCWRRRDRKQHLEFGSVYCRSTFLAKFSLSPLQILDGSIKDDELASLPGWYFKFPSSVRAVRKSCASQLPNGLPFALFSQLLPSPGI